MNFDAFIECNIYGISLLPTENGNIVNINIVDHTSNGWILSAYGVTEMIITNFILQNIIDHISVFTTDSNDIRKKLFFLLRGCYPKSKDDLNWCGVKNTMSDILSGKSLLLEIEPICGAYMLLLAASISLNEWG